MATKARETLLVETWHEEEDARCCVCGDEIEPGADVVWEPSPHIHPQARETAHPGCSVSNGYRLEWPT
jgi:hypothetical protein